MASACTNDEDGPSVPDPNEVVSALLEAWNESDVDTMAGFFENESTVLESEIERALRRAPGKDVADGFEVTLAEEARGARGGGR